MKTRSKAWTGFEIVLLGWATIYASIALWQSNIGIVYQIYLQITMTYVVVKWVSDWVVDVAEQQATDRLNDRLKSIS